MLLVSGGLNHKTLYHGDQKQENRANNIVEAKVGCIYTGKVSSSKRRQHQVGLYLPCALVTNRIVSVCYHTCQGAKESRATVAVSGVFANLRSCK
jgi:hypothetical protein